MGHDQHFVVFNGTEQDRKYQEVLHVVRVNIILRNFCISLVYLYVCILSRDIKCISSRLR